MTDLLQKLWDEYQILVDAISDATDDVEITDASQTLLDAVSDTPEMAKLRGDLYDAGVKNIKGITYDL